MDWVDAEELAAVICDLGDEYDSSDVEDALFEKFDLSFEQFHKIADQLIKFTPILKSPLTDEHYHAFVSEGFAIAKIKADVSKKGG